MRRIALDQNRIAHDLWTQVELLKHQLAQFVRARFGASSEQLPGQGDLFAESVNIPVPPALPATCDVGGQLCRRTYRASASSTT
jgi:hypothetical protein